MSPAPTRSIALDALTGNALWHYSRPASPGMVGDAKLGTNRGVAILRDKVFFVTDNAHLLALDRASGKLLWETSLGPSERTASPYGGTFAPLIVDDTVIAGVAGADRRHSRLRRRLQASDGALVWRHWTVPAGRTRLETWRQEPLGGGSTWLTGSYDPSSDTLYWATGNPWPDGDDRDRPGDNLYTNCVLALNANTGELKWHYQFTPHDLKDRDATEPNVLVDTIYNGKPRSCCFTRIAMDSSMCSTAPTANCCWPSPSCAASIGRQASAPTARPVVTDPRGCPSDAANWDSTAFSPETRLYYFMALEECVGKPTGYPDQTGQRFLRALNIETGEIVWEVPQPGPARAKTWSGILATAGGLIFYGQPNGGFTAADQRTGKTLWQFPTNVRMKASPMTFTFAGNQYIAVAAGPNILCFGLEP